MKMHFQKLIKQQVCPVYPTKEQAISHSHWIISILLYLISAGAYANDGAFFAKGNQLIPIRETDITVRKEILQIKKVQNRFIEVSVYYEFYNPKEEKEITVGFEAFSPEGDVDGTPKNGLHPYMRDFTVNLNGKIMVYDVAYVTDTLYNRNKKISSIDLDHFAGSKSGNYTDFFYVYHFKARFKKGLNIVKHTYNYDISASVDYNYDFEYVLTAAKRWGNKQIDDFTLIIDNEAFETFFIGKTFFKDQNEWSINGIGKAENIKGHPNSFIENDMLKFHVQKGNITFKKKNFKPSGDLFLFSQNYTASRESGYIPFSYYQEDNIAPPKNDFQKKVLKNLPFARRGYIFQNQELNHFYEQLDWYIPNPSYIPNIETLTEREKKWIEKWK